MKPTNITKSTITISITRSITIKSNNLLLKVKVKETKRLHGTQHNQEKLSKNMSIPLPRLLPLNKSSRPIRLLMLPREMLLTLKLLRILKHMLLLLDKIRFKVKLDTNNGLLEEINQTGLKLQNQHQLLQFQLPQYQPKMLFKHQLPLLLLLLTQLQLPLLLQLLPPPQLLQLKKLKNQEEVELQVNLTHKDLITKRLHPLKKFSV